MMSTDDLIDKLREPVDWAHFVNEDHAQDYAELMRAAADRIEELQKKWINSKTAAAKGFRRANERRVELEAYKKALSADFICLVLSEQARVANGMLDNSGYLAVAIVEGIEERIAELIEGDDYTKERALIKDELEAGQ